MKAPPELIDAIACQVYSPHDVLSLALTCNYVASVLIPRHAQYRVIRCSPLEGYHLWTLLRQDKSLARNVRILHLYDMFESPQNDTPLRRRVPLAFVPFSTPISLFGTKALFPPGCGGNTPGASVELVAERALIGAIRNMVELGSFTWTAHHPLIDSRRSPIALDIWGAIGYSQNLLHLAVENFDPFPSHSSPIHDSTVRSSVH